MLSQAGFDLGGGRASAHRATGGLGALAIVVSALIAATPAHARLMDEDRGGSAPAPGTCRIDTSTYPPRYYDCKAPPRTHTPAKPRRPPCRMIDTSRYPPRYYPCAAPPKKPQSPPKAPTARPEPASPTTSPPPAPPGTPVIQAYLTLTRKLAGRCTGTYITDLGEFRANPDDWHDRATPLRKEREHGIFNTNVWGQVGVTQFRLSRRCVNGSNYHAVGSPTVYVHRELREEFACWATGCQPLGLYAGPWQPGSD